jgi:hypothetical protein
MTQPECRPKFTPCRVYKTPIANWQINQSTTFQATRAVGKKGGNPGKKRVSNSVKKVCSNVWLISEPQARAATQERVCSLSSTKLHV